ncbi:hypothetical protein D9M69_620600 [compost metagenome]
MVVQDGVRLDVHVAVVDHRRHGQVLHRIQHVGIALVARRDDHAVHAAQLESVQDADFALRVIEPVSQQQHVAGVEEAGLERPERARIERVGDVGEHAADGLAAARTQSLRRMIGAITQRGDGAFDFSANFGRDVGGAVDHARRAAHRGASQGRDVPDADFFLPHVDPFCSAKV